MADTAVAPPASVEPPAPAAPPAAPSVQPEPDPAPSVDDALGALDTLSGDQIDALLAGASSAEVLALGESEEPSTPAPEPAPGEPAPAAPAEPAAEPPPSVEPGETPPAEPEPAPEPPASRRGRARVSLAHLAPEEQTLVMDANTAVRNGEYPSFIEAYTALSPQPEGAQSPAEPVAWATPTEVPPAAPPVPLSEAQQLDAEIVETEASLDLAIDDFDQDAQKEAAKKLPRLQAARAVLDLKVDQENRDEEARQHADQDYEKNYDANWAKVVEADATMADENSPIHRMVFQRQEYLDVMAQSGDQAAKDFLADPNHLAAILAEQRELLGTPASVPAQPTANPTAIPAPVGSGVPARTARPVGTLGQPSGAPELDASAAIALLKSDQLIDADIGNTDLIDQALELAVAKASSAGR